MADRQRRNTTGRTGNGSSAYRSTSYGSNSYYGNRSYYGSSYEDDGQELIYGNTVRKLEEERQAAVRRQLEEEPKRRLSNEARKNREKASHMSIGYVTFLVAAMCLTGAILVNYIQMQAQVTTLAETVAAKEQTLNDLTEDNDEALTRIELSIDYEEIKRIAIGELGMVYASEGQVETYSSGEGADYLKKVDD